MLREEDIRNAFEELIMELDRDLLQDPRTARKDLIMSAVESVKYRLIKLMHKESFRHSAREEATARIEPRKLPSFEPDRLTGLGRRREEKCDTELSQMDQDSEEG